MIEDELKGRHLILFTFLNAGAKGAFITANQQKTHFVVEKKVYVQTFQTPFGICMN